MVRRLYVEKKPGFDIEAKGLFEDIRQNLQLSGLSGVRVINRYDIEGIDDETYESAKYTVFAEPAIDQAFDEKIEIAEGSVFFASEYLPGQYDQRADSAAQCIQLISMKAKPLVKFARVIVLLGTISVDEAAAARAYCINPVDSQEASMGKPEKLAMDMPVPADVAVVDGFIDFSDEEAADYRRKMGFAMSDADLRFVRDYFASDERRDPTITELKVIDTYWSDHCRHTTFQTVLTDVTFGPGKDQALLQEAYQDYLNLRSEVYGDRNKDICLMDIAVIGAKYLKKQGLLDDLDESDEINACSIKIKAVIDGKEEDWLLMFKNETHNHPTEIEPFGGAATCLGGAIRDPLSGRVYVYQAMRVTGSGDPRTKIADTMDGKLPQRKITRSAAHGYSSYGNQIGLATGHVAEIYDEGYVAKRMEVGAVIGAAPAENVVRMKPEAGDVIILVGGRTGRDGCGGATGSSKEHTEDSILNCGAEVQKGNPPVERNIQRMFRRKEVAQLIRRCNDFGAGGVSVAVGELADSIDVNLDSVLKKYDGLDGTELAISESQERMAVVVKAADAETFIHYANEENLEAVQVAVVTDTGRFRMEWRGKTILDLSRSFLDTNGVKQEAKVFLDGGDGDCCEQAEQERIIKGSMAEQCTALTEHAEYFAQKWMETVTSLNCASQKGLTEMFDSTIGAGSVLMPLGGKHQLTPAMGMAAKIPVTSGYTDTASFMTYGFDPEVSKASPFRGAICAVVDSATKLTAMGGDYTKARLSFQEYFERLGDAPEKWGRPLAALLGALRAQTVLGIPAIGGKDSMSGTFMDISVPPTLISFAVAAADARDVISAELKAPDSRLVYVKAGTDAHGVVDLEQFKRNMAAVHSMAKRHLIRAASTVGRGGIAAAITKMAAGNGIGVRLSIEPDKMEDLYSADYGALILEVSRSEALKELLGEAGAAYRVIGETTAEPVVEVFNAIPGQKVFGISLATLIAEWEAPLEKVFPTASGEERTDLKPLLISYAGGENAALETARAAVRAVGRPMGRIAKPRIYIPAFPGTNCEMDSKRAFDGAGGDARIQILRNLTQSDLDETIAEMERMIRASQIIMLPGGFSGGDEPDGSAKFITAVFRNPMIQEAVTDLLDNRDGLILGVCNGFQALIKLGLVPSGKISEVGEDSPTLTYNNIGRHMSRLVATRISSVKSPWLSNVSVGDIHAIPVSHGEGRFIADEALVAELIRNGQVTTQYVDLEGNPTYDVRYNPNNSVEAIEGITSPDGRVFGKMGHSERIGKNLYRNVLGETDQRIFKAGVAYFE